MKLISKSLFYCIILIMQKNKNKKNKEVKIDIKDMGVDIDKNEYREIILSQSNHPEKMDYDKYYN